MAIAVGLSLRPDWIPALARARKTSVDVLEVMIDDLVHAPAKHVRQLRRLGRRWPILAHGVGLGIGAAQGLDLSYVDAIAEACARVRARWYTEHLCFVRAGGVELGHFVAVDDDRESLEVLARNAAEVRARVDRPLLLENPADVLGPPRHARQPTPAPGRRLARAYTRSLHAAEAGALLDLTNLLYDARNSGWAVDEFWLELDFERVVEIHLAGGVEFRGLWIDSHSRPVETEALALLAEVVTRAPNLRAVIIEWDEQLPTIERMLAEVARVRQVVAEARLRPRAQPTQPWACARARRLETPLELRQTLLARFLDDPSFAAQVRADPAASAALHGASPAYVAWLASLESRRVVAFRRGQATKARRRADQN